MSLFERLFSRKIPKEDARIVKNYGWERVGYVLSQHWVMLIGLNLLYLLCCLPVVTIPAATCGMHRVILNLVRENAFEDMFPAFFREFKTNFLKRTGFGLLLMIAPFSLTYYPLLLGMEGGVTAMFVITVVLYFCITKYFYPLLVLLDVSVWQNFKNACIMALVEWKTTLQQLLTAGLIDAFLLLMTLQAAPLYILFLCAFNCLLGCAFVNYPFEKYFGEMKQ